MILLQNLFLGHAYATTLQDKLHECCSSLGLSGPLQVSMDGPNVNRRAFDLLNDQLEGEVGHRLLNAGSCGLHTLHNSFRSGFGAVKWELEHSFNCLYHLFKDSPARREDFTSLTGSSVFPRKFCQTRWIENVPVAERVLEMWANVQKYVEAVKAKKLPDPKNKSFIAVADCATDPLFLPRVHTFISIARDVSPFLTLYQTDMPMLPFLSADLVNVLRNLLRRFLKPAEMDKLKSPAKLLGMDVTDRALHMDGSKVDIGFAAGCLLDELRRKKTVSE